MPKYLIKAHYTAEGARGIAQSGGTSRRDFIAGLLEAHGGRMESFYFAFGPDDALVIGDLPDNETVTAIALAVNGSGAVTVDTVVLLTPEQVDAAVKKAVDYRPPGS